VLLSDLLSYPLNRYTLFSARYFLRGDEIIVPRGFCSGQGSRALCEQVGASLNSSAGYTVFVDQRNDPVRPTRGWTASLRQDFAGIGGDVNYVKSEVEGAWFWGITPSWVVSLQGSAGYVSGWNGDAVRINDRFFKGGNSFRGFAVSTKKVTVASQEFAAPKGPGRAYSVQDILAMAPGKLAGRDFENGRAMYNSVGCAACHRFDGAGGGVGPDLSGVASRYTLRDLMENIIEPSKVISDQYGSEEVLLKDGSTLVGRAYAEGGKLVVTADPRNPDESTSVALDEVKSRKPYPVSLMPAGMINGLNKDEILNLVAYLQSGGDPKHPAFAK